jgi:Tol biopolymer transport system component
MGIVYLAHQHDPVYREVAIKVLKPGVETSEVLRRFETERQALALMEHPNIARFYCAGTSRLGRPYFVMEVVDGLPITAACDRHTCTLAERLVLFSEVCRAIEHAHRKGIVHRDIKPSNILVIQCDERLVAKVIDFGIARIVTGHLTGRTVATSFGELLGTPEYMSPEQAAFDGRPIGRASDIYSLGVVLYELLAGCLPFDPARLRERGISEAIRIIRDEQAPSPAATFKHMAEAHEVAKRRKTNPETLRHTLSGDLARVLKVCLQKDPKLRYRSAGSLADDIDRYLRGEAVLAEGPSLEYTARRWLKRHRVSWGIAAVTVVAAALGVLVSAWLFSPQSSPPGAPPVLRPLTSYTGTEMQPSFSPDGKQFAFVWDGGTGNFDVYKQSVEGGSPVRLTTDAALDLFPSWSPDGLHIAFIRVSPSDNSLYIRPATAGQERRLVSIETRELDWMANPQLFTHQPGPTWSRDSKYLIISDCREPDGTDSLYEISIDNGHWRKLTNPEPGSLGDFSPALSPNGRFLAFVHQGSTRGDSTINLLSDDHIVRRIWSEERGISSLAWMSDSQLLFTSNRSGPNLLWRLRVGGGVPSPILGAGRGMSFISYARATGAVAFAQENWNTNIWRVRLKQSGRGISAEKFLSSSRKTDSAEYSPDGKAVVFVSDRLGTRQIWGSKADGSDPVQLSRVAPETPIGTPRWSADGRQIVYDTMRNRHSAIAIMNADGTQPHIFASDAWDDMMPSWSHDGLWIYFACKVGGTLKVCRKAVAGGETESITTRTGGEPRESPDGRFVFYAAAKGMWRVPRDGGQEAPLPGLQDADPKRYWTVVNDAIYLLKSTRKPWVVYRYVLATGAISPMVTIEKQPDFGSPGLAVSPDLDYLLFGRIDQQGTDIAMVEGIPHS